MSITKILKQLVPPQLKRNLVKNLMFSTKKLPVLQSAPAKSRNKIRFQLDLLATTIIWPIIQHLCQFSLLQILWAWWVAKSESSTHWCLQLQIKTKFKKVANLAHANSVNWCITSLRLWWILSKKHKICYSEINCQQLQKENDQCQTISKTTVLSQTTKDPWARLSRTSLTTVVRNYKT